MRIWQRFLTKKNTGKEAYGVNEPFKSSAIPAILTKIEKTLKQIINDHKMTLLDKDVGYVIDTVCGSSGKGTPTECQVDIYNKINPTINEIYDLLGIANLSRQQQQDGLFVIRYMMVLKILFLMEYFKNMQNQNTIQKKSDVAAALEEMEALGNA